MIRALICDLDNTLFSSRSVPQSIVQPVLEAVRATNRVRSLLRDERLEEALEASWDTSFDEVARLYALPEALCQAWSTAADRLEVTGQLHPYPDVAVLWSLPLRRFLVTTGYRRFQESKIAALQLTGRFEAIYVDALGDPGRVGKEELFRRLLVEHELAPREVAVLGDSAESELAAGSRVGLWTIQILRERTIPATDAHHRVHTLHDLPALLDQLS